MSKRLQVLLDEGDYRRIQREARRRGITVAGLVREALRDAWDRDEEIGGSPERKLGAVRAAVRQAFPAGDIERMLDEIDAGRHDGAL
jgi:hypothetical protein